MCDEITYPLIPKLQRRPVSAYQWYFKNQYCHSEIVSWYGNAFSINRLWFLLTKDQRYGGLKFSLTKLQHAVELKVELPLSWDAMTPIRRYCNVPERTEKELQWCHMSVNWCVSNHRQVHCLFNSPLNSQGNAKTAYMRRIYRLLVVYPHKAGVYTKFSGRLSEEPFPGMIQKFPCIFIFKTGQPGCQLNLSDGQIRLDLTSGRPLM